MASPTPTSLRAATTDARAIPKSRRTPRRGSASGRRANPGSPWCRSSTRTTSASPSATPTSRSKPYPVELPASFDDDPTAAGRAPELRAHAGSRRENRTPTDHAEWIHYLRLYCHLLERNDPLLGSVLDALAARADAERTIVVYTSDHGEMGGAHRMAQKRFLYEESVRVPLVLVYPGVEKGTTTDRLASNVDLAPTLAALAGVKWPTALPGKDLLGGITSEPATRRCSRRSRSRSTRVAAERAELS